MSKIKALSSNYTIFPLDKIIYKFFVNILTLSCLIQIHKMGSPRSIYCLKTCISPCSGSTCSSFVTWICTVCRQIYSVTNSNSFYERLVPLYVFRACVRVCVCMCVCVCVCVRPCVCMCLSECVNRYNMINSFFMLRIIILRRMLILFRRPSSYIIFKQFSIWKRLFLVNRFISCK